MSYRDDAQAMRERLAALEKRASEADRLARRAAQLEQQNLELRRELETLRPPPPAPAPSGDDPGELPALRLSAAALQKWRELWQRAQWDEISNLLDLESRTCEAADAVPVLLHLGATCSEKLSDIDRAIGAYQRVLELAPDNRHALLALEACYQQTERWMDLCALLERQVELCNDARSIAALYLRLARVTSEVLGDREKAIDYARRSLEAHPSEEAEVFLLEEKLFEE